MTTEFDGLLGKLVGPLSLMRGSETAEL